MSGELIPAPVRAPWHELLKSAPLVIILLYLRLRDGAPVTQAEIAEQFQIDRKTAAVYLRQMNHAGMIMHVGHNDGYQLAIDGQQMLLDLEDAGWGKNGHPTDGWGKIGHPTLKESLIKDLKDFKKEGKNQMSVFWTSPDGLTTEKILAATGMLFASATIQHGIADRDPSLAMCLVAHAYDQRNRLAKPQIFIYRRLQTNTLPDKKYLSDPLSFLPNEYLVALDLAEPEIVEAEEPKAELDGFGRHRIWLEIIRDERVNAITMCKKSGCPSEGLEQVRFDGREMAVSISSHRLMDFQAHLTGPATDVLRELLGRDDANVRFVSVETEPA